MKTSLSLSTLALAAMAFAAAQSPALAQTAARTSAANAAPASTSTSAWYVGGSIGPSSLKLRTDNIAPSKINGEQDTHDTGFKLMGGYQINNYFAVEAAYFDLGKYKYTKPSGQIVAKTQGLSLAGVGSWHITPGISALGKLGFAQQHFSGDLHSSGSGTAHESVTRTVPLVGVGAEYSLSKNVKLRAEYEYFGVPTLLTSGNQKIKLHTDLISFGVRYVF